MAKNQVEKLEGNAVNNPYGMTERAVAVAPEKAVTQAESQRAMVEVMTSFEVAKRFPRDPALAMSRILAECSRPSLAEVAVYQFSRGGTDINGPSIRLMEAIARAWGNTQFGFRTLERRAGSSSLQAFARDLETNTFIERTFDLRHWRDTKGGGYPIKEERDIYELEANMSQRRVRSCIIGLIPGDVIDAAVEQCELTMKTNADTSPEGIKKLLETFAAIGVNRAMLEARIQCKLEAVKPVQFVSLRKQFVALRDGMAQTADFFDTALADSSKETKKDGPDLKKEAEKKKPKKDEAKETPETDAPETAKDAPSDFDRIKAELLAAKDKATLDAAWCDGGDIEGPNAAILKNGIKPQLWNQLRSIHEDRTVEFQKGTS